MATVLVAAVAAYLNYVAQRAYIEFVDTGRADAPAVAFDIPDGIGSDGKPKAKTRVRFHLWNTGTLPAEKMSVTVRGGAAVDVPPNLPAKEAVFRQIETDWIPIKGTEHMLFVIGYDDPSVRRERQLCVHKVGEAVHEASRGKCPR